MVCNRARVLLHKVFAPLILMLGFVWLSEPLINRLPPTFEALDPTMKP